MFFSSKYYLRRTSSKVRVISCKVCFIIICSMVQQDILKMVKHHTLVKTMAVLEEWKITLAQSNSLIEPL